MNAKSFDIAIACAEAWTDVLSEQPAELFDDIGSYLGVVYVRFVSSKQCVIDRSNFRMFPERNEYGELARDSNGRILILIAKSSSLRNSNIWP